MARGRRRLLVSVLVLLALLFAAYLWQSQHAAAKVLPKLPSLHARVAALRKAKLMTSRPVASPHFYTVAGEKAPAA